MRSKIVIYLLVNVIVSSEEEVFDLIGEDFGEEHKEAVVDYFLPILAGGEQDVGHVD